MKRIVIMLDPHEKLVKEGGATHRVKLEGVGGKLALTDKRLIFKSHKLNIQNHEQAFQLVGIHSVEAGKTGFLKNLLLVKLSDGTTEKFIVFEPDEWVREIKSGLSMVSA
jgi:hypothetical protein